MKKKETINIAINLYLEYMLLFCYVGFGLMDETRLIIDTQRLKYMGEFVDSMTKKSFNPRSSVLFSGPNGVGKSSILLLTFLVCFIRGLPISYIPSAIIWSKIGSTQDKAHQFFMKAFYNLNADIIESDPGLYAIFEDQIKSLPIDPDSYIRLSEAVGQKKVRMCGCLVDEIQALTKAADDVEIVTQSDGVPKLEKMKSSQAFFATDFTIWTNLFGSFASQLCASAYGLREFSLPSGESRRLRFIGPFSKKDSKLLLASPASPLCLCGPLLPFVDDVVDISGCMPRLLFELVTDMEERPPLNAMEAKVFLKTFEERMFFELVDVCDKKFVKFLKSQSLVSEAMQALQRVLKGEEYFSPTLKNLYDHGLLHINASTNRYYPCSPIAASVMYKVYVDNVRSSFQSMESLGRAEQGFEFERQILASLHKNRFTRLTCYQYRKPSLAESVTMELQPCRIAYFDSLSELVRHRFYSTLWLSRDASFTCDGVIVPSVEDDEKGRGDISVLEVSVSDPFKGDRIKKVRDIKSKVADVLQAQLEFISSRINTIYFFDKPIAKATTNSKATMDSYPEHTYLVDRAGSIMLGVLL